LARGDGYREGRAINITVIGMGRVGLVVGACLAELGNNVFCLDTDQERIGRLSQGELPAREPGLEDLVRKNVGAGRLFFSGDVPQSVAHAPIQFVAVGTPSDGDGGADLRDVLAAAHNIGRYMRDFKVVVMKSTVPVGTAEKVHSVVLEAVRGGPAPPSFSVVSNPEFLREGTAVEDFMRPDRIVLGVSGDGAGQSALAMLRGLYAPLNVESERTCVMDNRSAEFAKYAANAMLATRVSFMNELANLAEPMEVDMEMVRAVLGWDPRIGPHYLEAGAGYGGSCLPKDVKALLSGARAHGYDLRMLGAVDAVNVQQQQVLARKVMDYFDSKVRGRIFAVWGLAFKPGTDDVRAAPSRAVIGALVRAGARVVAHDPAVAIHGITQALARDLADSPDLMGSITFADTPLDALQNVDALVLVTGWDAYRDVDFEALRARMKSTVIFDGRNLYDPALMAAQGFTYFGIGRGTRRV